MASDQRRQNPQTTATEAGSRTISAVPTVATQAIDMSAMIPFPRSEEEPPTGASSQPLGFAPLPFDESLITTSGANASASVATPANGNSASATATAAAGLPNFFLDTAALAQHLAAAVADEQKLSDNIMDLIPPPMLSVSVGGNTTAAPSSELMTSAAGTSVGVAASSVIPMVASLSTPLAPPPDLMLRALSPPTSLLPEFVQPPTISLAASAAESVKSEGAVSTKAVNGSSAATSIAAAPAASSAVLGHSALLKKRKSVEAFDDVKNERAVAVSTNATTTTPVTSMSAVSAALYHSSTNGNSSSLNTAAAVAAAAAREKVMKEPQSGDLYECVITKRNGGLGLTLACVDDHVQITGLAPDTPAASSGICVGDTLVAVSGLPVRGLQFSTVIGRLKSTSRNSVVLKLRRNPFRQNAGSAASYRGIKRPARASAKTSSESNSATVLTSKSLALETRLGGSLNGHHHHHHGNLHSSALASNASNLLSMGGSSGSSSTAATSEGLHQLQVKTDPTNSTYFATDPSIFSMGSATVSMSAALANADLGWKVTNEEKDRYYAECRSLRTELAQAVGARRQQKRHLDEYTGQLQRVVDAFQRDMQSLLAAPGATGGGSSTNDDLAALRQKLLEVNHALARQQTEILELKERDARHALPESQRVKWQVLTLIRKKILSLDLKASAVLCSAASVLDATQASAFASPSASLTIKSGANSGGSAASGPLSFEERVEGVRPSVFELLFGQDMKVHAMAAAPSVELDLDAKACTQILGWNLRELVVQSAVPYVVSVAGCLRVKYLQTEEALAVSWKFGVRTLT